MWQWLRRKSSNVYLDLQSAIWGDSNGGTVTSSTALKVSDIYSCIRLVASTVSALPINLCYTDVKRGRATDNKLHQLLHYKPNSWMTPSDLKRLCVMHLMLRGNFYAFVNRVGGAVVELIPLNPDLVEVQQLEDLSLEYVVTLANGTKNALQQSDVLHIRGLSTNGYLGENVVSLLTDIFGYAKDANQYKQRTLTNGAKPSGLLVFPNSLTDEQYLKESERIEKAASGARAGSTLILDRGVTFQKVSFSPTDLQLIEAMKLTRSQICGVFGVPPHMIGDLDRATFSNIEHQDIGYFKHSIAPLLTAIEEALNRDLLSDKEQLEFVFKFNPDALLRGDVKTRMEAFQIGIMCGIYSPNDVRALQDLAPRNDGLGGTYYYPANLLPANQRIETDEVEGLQNER